MVKKNYFRLIAVLLILFQIMPSILAGSNLFANTLSSDRLMLPIANQINEMASLSNLFGVQVAHSGMTGSKLYILQTTGKLRNDEELISTIENMSPSQILLLAAEMCSYVEAVGASISDLVTISGISLSKVTPYLSMEQLKEIMLNDSYPLLFKIFMLDNAFAYSNSLTLDTRIGDTPYSRTIVELLNNDAIGEYLKGEMLNKYLGTEQPLLYENIIANADEPRLRMIAMRKLSAVAPDIVQNIVMQYMDNFNTNEKQFNDGLISLLGTLSCSLGESSAVYELLLRESSKYLKSISNTHIHKEDDYTASYVYALSSVGSIDSMKVLASNVKNINDNISNSILIAVHSNHDTLSLMLTSDEYSVQMAALLLIDRIPLEEFLPFLENCEAIDEVAYTLKNSIIDHIGKIAPSRFPYSIEGTAGYRDGVFFSLDWHTGIVFRDKDYSFTPMRPRVYIQASGTGSTSGTVNETVFLSGNTHKGFRTLPGMTDAQCALILAKAQQCFGISYPTTTITYQLTHGTVASGVKIEPSSITSFRCDGIVEYAFEYCGFRVMGTSTGNIWDISMPGNYLQHSIPCGMTPKNQASALTDSCPYY